MGKAVAVVTPDSDANSTEEECYDRCFDCYVWHDGEFPFTEDDSGLGGVRRLHHCMPSQFVYFGSFVMELQKKH